MFLGSCENGVNWGAAGRAADSMPAAKRPMSSQDPPADRRRTWLLSRNVGRSNAEYHRSYTVNAHLTAPSPFGHRRLVVSVDAGPGTTFSSSKTSTTARA